jgi:hypothetical protein
MALGRTDRFRFHPDGFLQKLSALQRFADLDLQESWRPGGLSIFRCTSGVPDHSLMDVKPELSLPYT